MFAVALHHRRFLLRILLLAALFAAAMSSAKTPRSESGSRQKNPFSRFQSREQWQMPGRVMDEIGLRPGLTIADVGAGDGWFTIFLAERVGPAGLVIAEDIDARALQAVRERCVREKISHVSILLGTETDPGLPAGQVDVAIMVNVLSALDNAKDFLDNLAQGLKPDGRLIVIDWDPGKLHPEKGAQAAESARRRSRRQLQIAGFEVVKTLDFLPVQSFWICERPARNGSPSPAASGAAGMNRKIMTAAPD